MVHTFSCSNDYPQHILRSLTLYVECTVLLLIALRLAHTISDAIFDRSVHKPVQDEVRPTWPSPHTTETSSCNTLNTASPQHERPTAHRCTQLAAHTIVSHSCTCACEETRRSEHMTHEHEHKYPQDGWAARPTIVTWFRCAYCTTHA